MINKKPKVAIVMGSDSDYPVLKDCFQILHKFEIEYEILVCSAHRTPDRASTFAKNAEKNGFDAIIAAAGKAAHLPGVLAAYTVLPVIGLPVKSSTMDGLDSLLSIVQMPNGIPVATVAINGAQNAALLAVQILSTGYSHLRQSLKEFKEEMAQKVVKSNEELNTKHREMLSQ